MQAFHIVVNRIKQQGAATLSTVSVNGVHNCFGLEDKFEPVKVPNETRIPANVYKVGVRTYGSKHKRYAEVFGDSHKGMLEVLNVEGFTDILIHIGNTHKDTAGCLCVGFDGVLSKPDAKVNTSTLAYKNFYNLVIDSVIAGLVTIEYIDSDK